MTSHNMPCFCSSELILRSAKDQIIFYVPIHKTLELKEAVLSSPWPTDTTLTSLFGGFEDLIQFWFF